MDLLGDQLTTRPIQTGWKFSMEAYPSGRCRFIDDPDRHFGNSSVWTRTQTRSDGPEPVLTLGSPSATTQISVRNTRVFRTALTALTEPRTL